VKRVGILGGTFNPIHIGHLIMAQAAFQKCNLDKVLFIPSFKPPHKSDKSVLSTQHRLLMVRRAVRGNSHFEASDIEVKRKGRSYSIDTVLQLRKMAKNKTKFYFIIGEDSLALLHGWKRIKELEKIVTFVVVNRPGKGKIKSKIKTKSISMPDIDLSSSFLRRQIAKGKRVEYLIPALVYDYIGKKKLYRF